ncbi:MAG: TolC family protein [Bdellovibrionaceae bacterium]|nr:TolC family protein [Bdellovibrionales bacterium]MCB9085250.1 TolC family protein [Pseudobdellovibrionaceae bacterium]
MLRLKPALHGSTLACLLLVTLGARGLTLSEAFEKAKENTSRIRNQTLSEEISQAQKREAYSSVLPELEISSTNTWREEVGGSGVTSSFGEGHQHTAQVTLRQALFQGGSEYHLLKAAKKYPDIAKWTRVQEEVDLYAELAQGFCDYLTVENEGKILSEQAALLDQRIKYLTNRVSIGRSKKTELYSARSQMARVSADIEAQKIELLKAKEELAKLTGMVEIAQVEDPLGAQVNWTNIKPTIDVEALPKLKAAQLILEQSRSETKAAKGDYLPEVDLTGNYYLDRAGVLASSDWDVSVTAKWQLYGGGATNADVRIKTLESRQLELEYEDLKRASQLALERLSQSLAMKVGEYKKLQEAVAAAERSYREHIRESRSGLVSDLDVLRALDDLLQVKRAANRSHFQAKNLFYELHQAAGVRP